MSKPTSQKTTASASTHGGQSNISTHCQPGAKRSNAKSQPEKDVGEVRETLGKRVEEHDHQGYWRKPTTQRVDRAMTHNPTRARSQRPLPTRSSAEYLSLWQVPFAVRGFNASLLRSTIRLIPIAAVRAHTIAARISRKIRQPGHPRLAFAATTIDASANGSANTVCEKRTNSKYFRMTNIRFF